MPLYKHSVTGLVQEMTRDAASVFAEGVLEEISPESAAEERERQRMEALAEKIDLEFEDDSQDVVPVKKEKK